MKSWGPALTAMLLLQSGCSWLHLRPSVQSVEPDAGAAVAIVIPSVDDGTDPGQDGEALEAVAKDIGLNGGHAGRECPPRDAPFRIRDLTRPWHERRYLLPDGRICRPGGAR